MAYQLNSRAKLFAQQIDNFRRVADQVRPNDLQQGGTASANVNRPDLLFDSSTLKPLRNVSAEDLSHIADNMRYGDFLHVPFSVGTTSNSAPIVARPQFKRTYILIENWHATNTLFVGFGVQPNANLGIKINPGGNYICDTVVAQNDIYLAASGASTTGQITYCDQDYGKN